VDLVDDVHLEAAFDGSVGDPVAQIADVVDAPVGGGVHLDDVEGHAFGDRPALLADAARMRRRLRPRRIRRPRAVESLGEDARRARLAGAARSGEDVGVGHGAGLDGVLERARDVRLADKLVERLGAVFTIEGASHRRASVPPVAVGGEAGRQAVAACRLDMRAGLRPRRPVAIPSSGPAPLPRVGGDRLTLAQRRGTLRISAVSPSVPLDP